MRNHRPAGKYRKLVLHLRKKRAALVAIAPVLSLGPSRTVLASRGSLWPATSHYPGGKQESAVAPEDFSARSPAKEYIYAGKIP